MVVAFTTNLGLAKPDESELASNWIEGSKLLEDNNIIIVDECDIGLTTYNPVILGSTTDPNIGSTGTLLGEYYDIQGFIMGIVTCLISGAGISAGSGRYGISLPQVVDSTFHAIETTLNADPGVASVIGEGYVTDASAVATSGTTSVDVATVTGVSYARLNLETFVGKGTSRNFSSTTPFVFATGDQFSFNFLYKKA